MGSRRDAEGLEPPSWEPFRRIGTIVDRAVPLISPWLTARSAAGIVHAAGADDALVADGDGTPLGVVSSVRLDGSAGGTTAREVMTPLGAILHESIPVSVAAALTPALGERRIAVVSDDRRAIGVLATSELLGWLARHRGIRT